MKFTKLSLVAALVIGSSAFAIENTKVSGDAKLYYNTSDAAATLNRDGSSTSGDLFDADNSAADIAVNLNVTTDLVKNDTVAISAGAGYTVLTTLGLENNLVGNTWGSAHTATSNNGNSFGNIAGIGGLKVNNANWVREAWVAATAGKTTVKVGRMELDTPIAFTEKWSIEQNTFEAAVVMNQDIPDTTLVGAFIGNGNGSPDGAHQVNGPVTLRTDALALAGVVNDNGDFRTFGTNGAYAIGAINNSFKPLTLQAWYYDVTRFASSYWLQADLACEKIKGLMAGVQFNSMTADTAGAKEDMVVAAMLGYKMEDTFTAKVAYSKVNSDGSLGGAGFNVATVGASGQSKLYTETWWGGNFGNVTAASAETIKVCASTPANGIADLAVHYTSVDNAAANQDMAELAITASKKFGPLDATLAYINTDDKAVNNGDASNAIQAYLTLNF